MAMTAGTCVADGGSGGDEGRLAGGRCCGPGWRGLAVLLSACFVFEIAIEDNGVVAGVDRGCSSGPSTWPEAGLRRRTVPSVNSAVASPELLAWKQHATAAACGAPREAGLVTAAASCVCCTCQRAGAGEGGERRAASVARAMWRGLETTVCPHLERSACYSSNREAIFTAAEKVASGGRPCTRVGWPGVHFDAERGMREVG